MRISGARTATAVAAAALVLTAGPAVANGSHDGSGHGHGHDQGHGGGLEPRSHFTMEADGSSGLKPDGDGIPNIDSVKKTIAVYYDDPGTGIANKDSSPYISEMRRIETHSLKWLQDQKRRAARQGRKPAIVLDADDTTLMTYDMEVAAMHFNFDPALQDVWVQDQRFPATPGMVDYVRKAQSMGFSIFGLTGRNDDQKAATIGNLEKVGFTAFDSGNFYTKWTGRGASQQPSYITCATAKCTTVEYKAGTRRHIEKDLGYDIVLNVGDQWSDLQGGYADHTLKLPNPTYYLPSPNLPGVNEPELAPRTHFPMEPDGSSGLEGDGEGIPNIDSVKATIRTYYAASSAGIAAKDSSPYISELSRLTARQAEDLAGECTTQVRSHHNPAIVFDADDTTLWTYDMEDGAMHFNFDPALQDVWVQDQRFPATPGMVALVNRIHDAGCTVVGITGRNDNQRTATIANLRKLGYEGFTEANYYTKWTGSGASQQPSYVSCATAKCTTIEYKSQTRKHVESRAGGGYRIIANLGDQFSDLKGGYADKTVKLPNPTYYLP
jgi:predicted secreted acid phosphatase